MIKELEFELTKKDVFKFSFFHNEIKNKFSLIFSIIVFIMLIMFGLYIIVFNVYDLYIFLAGFFILFFIFLILPVVIATLRFKNINLNIKIDSESPILMYKNIYGYSELNWNKAQEICKTRFLLLIYIIKNQALVIPKRIFESEQEMNETWELIQECYNKNREE